MSIQLKGNLKLGPTPGTAVEFGASITAFIIKRTRASVAVPATLATGRESESAGALSEAVQIDFFSSTAASSVWAELYDAIDTDSSQLYFEGTLNPGAVSADNPRFSGYITVLTLDTGATVGALRTQSQTYPVTQAGITKAIV
jgi:hypothetical protein